MFIVIESMDSNLKKDLMRSIAREINAMGIS